jgi:hypothetical protein
MKQTEEMTKMKAQLAEYEELYGGADGGAVDHTLHGEVAKMFMAAVSVNPRDPDLHVISSTFITYLFGIILTL